MDTATTKDEITFELAYHEDLAENIIAYVFAYNPRIDISDKTQFFDNVRSYYERFKENKPTIERPKGEEQNIVEDWYGKDLRVRQIIFDAVKGFPPSDPPFKIEFTSDNEPTSMVVLGANGSGKSSVFEILEYVFCGKIGEVDLREFEQGNNDRYRLYLENFNEGIDRINGKVKTLSEDFDVKNDSNIPEKVRKKVNPETHFISDYDIYSKGQINYLGDDQNSFHNTVARSLGFEELLNFEKELKMFVNYNRMTEKLNIKKAKRNIRKQKEFINANEEAIRKKKAELQNIEEESESTESKKKIEELRNIIQDIKSDEVSFKFDLDEFQEIRRTFLNAYEEYSSSVKSSIGIKELSFLREGIEQVKNFNDCPFCENSRSNINEIISHVESRIEEIENLEVLEKKVNSNFRSLLNIIEDKSSQILANIFRIEDQTSKFLKRSEFNSLFELQSNFEDKVFELINEEIINEINNIRDNKNFLNDEYKFLAKLIRKENQLGEQFKQVETFHNQFSEIKTDILNTIEGKILALEKDSEIEKRIRLETEIKNIQRQLNDAKENLSNNRNDLENYTREKELFDEIHKSTEEYQKEVSKWINKRVNKSFQLIKIVVEKILQNYFNRQNRDVELLIEKMPNERDEETGKIISEIMTAYIKKKNSEKKIPVSKYLNTFHYRLFATMVSVSIAIASRMKTKINIPLVIDDVFYASDFENRSSIEIFLKSLFDSFNRYTTNMKLQLILFTHDEIMFDSASKVVNELEFLETKDLTFTKLIPHEDSKVENGYKNILFKFSRNYRREIIEREYQLL